MVDGRIVGTTNFPQDIVLPSNYDFKLGAYDSTNPSFKGRFLGEMPLAMVHNRRLTNEEVSALQADPYQFLEPV